MSEKETEPTDPASASARIVRIKKDVRESVIARRSRMPRSIRDEQSAKIASHAATLLDEMQQSGFLNPGDIIHLFCSFGEEVATDHLRKVIERKGFDLVVPVVFGRGNGSELILSRVGLETRWTPGPYQIPEPHPLNRVDVSRVALFFLPGVAFDRSGGRIGYGKGYYDKLLAKLPRDVPRVALAFSCQMLPEIPVTSQDVFMTMIVTEEETIRCDRQKEN